MALSAIVARVAIVASALALAFLSARVTVVHLLPATMLTGNRLAGDNPAVFLDIARRAAIAGPVDDLLPRSRRAAAQQPLADEPFLLAAADALHKGDAARADRLLGVALRREPRLRQARLMLLEQYAREGQVPQLTEQLIVLARLVPDTDDLFVATVAQLVADPRTRSATVRGLRGSPIVVPVLEKLTEIKADPAVVLDLARSRLRGQPARDRLWQARLVANLVAAGDYLRARSLWRSFLPAGARRSSGSLYNPQFADAPGAPPFNWNLAEGDGDIGVAERSRDGALEAVYYGRSSGELASQLLLLRPSTYELSFSAEGRRPDDAGEIAWSVTCAGASAPLATLPIGDATEPTRLRFTFTVPASCPAQWLRLTGTAKEFPRTRTLLIRGLSLDRRGS